MSTRPPDRGRARDPGPLAGGSRDGCRAQGRRRPPGRIVARGAQGRRNPLRERVRVIPPRGFERQVGRARVHDLRDLCSVGCSGL